MKVCILAFSHDVLEARVFFREALTLHRGGHQVTLIGRGDQDKAARVAASGIRCRAFAARPRSQLKKMLTDPTMLWRYFLAGWQANAEVYHCHEPQSLLLGIVLARLRRARLVYDCHEYQPESYAERFGPRASPLVKKGVRALERLAVRLVDGVVTVNEHLAERFRQDCKLVAALPNYPLLETFQNVAPPPHEWRARCAGRKVLIYAGGMSAERGISACLQVVAHLRTQTPEVLMLFIGHVNSGYAREIEKLVQELEGSVEFLGQIAYHHIPAHLQLGDLGLFLAQPVRERYDWGEPIKFFEYAAAGLPVVLSDLPAKRRLVQEVGNGILVDPLDHAAAARAIADLLRDDARRAEMARRGREAFLSRLNWQAIEARLLSVYEQLGHRQHD
ncbi:MAG: glycosyltransferase family 4 protein [Chloroflexota bacterium]